MTLSVSSAGTMLVRNTLSSTRTELRFRIHHDLTQDQPNPTHAIDDVKARVSLPSGTNSPSQCARRLALPLHCTRSEGRSPPGRHLPPKCEPRPRIPHDAPRSQQALWPSRCRSQLTRSPKHRGSSVLFHANFRGFPSKSRTTVLRATIFSPCPSL